MRPSSSKEAKTSDEDEVESGSDEYKVEEGQTMAPPPLSMGQSLRIKVKEFSIGIVCWG